MFTYKKERHLTFKTSKKQVKNERFLNSKLFHGRIHLSQ